MQTTSFDPRSIGGVPASDSQQFDPSKIGGVPVKTGADTTKPSFWDRVQSYAQEAASPVVGAAKEASKQILNIAGGIRSLPVVGPAIKSLSPDPLEGIARAVDRQVVVNVDGQPLVTDLATARRMKLTGETVGNKSPAPYSMFNAEGAKMMGLEPEGIGENIGAIGLNTAEFFAPGGAVTKFGKLLELAPRAGKVAGPLVKAVNLASKGAIEGGAMGGVAAFQGGNVPLAAGLGAASPLIKPLVEAVAERAPAAVVNNMLRPLQKQYRFGKNPGQAVVDEGIVAPSLPRLIDKVRAVQLRVGGKIGEVLDAPENQMEVVLTPKRQPLQLPAGPRMMGPSNPGEVPQTIFHQADIAPWIETGRFADVRPAEQRLRTIYTGESRNPSRLAADMENAKNSQQIEWINQQAEKTGLLRQLQEEARAAGEPIPTRLTDVYDVSFAGKSVNIDEQLGALDEGIRKATEVGDDALIAKLEDTKRWLSNQMGRDASTGRTIPIGPRGPVSPKEATRLKGLLGEETRWTGEAYDKPLNEARARTYGKIRSAIEEQTPEVAPLNEHYSSLLEAVKAAERKAAANPNIRLTELGAGALGEGLMPHAGIPALLTAFGLRTTLGATALAQALKRSVGGARILRNLVAAGSRRSLADDMEAYRLGLDK
jgi:hypothetical protein